MDYDRETRTGAGETGRTAGTTGTPGTGTTGMTGTPGTTGTTGADDAGTRAGSYDRKFVEGGNDSMGDGLEEGRERVSEKLDEGREAISSRVEQGRERLSGAVDGGKNRVADQLERLGDRIENRATEMDQAGGVQRRAGQFAHRTSGALDSGADYIRTHDPAEMRDDLEQAIRERPLMSVGMALGAGFLLARLLRD